MSDEPTQDRSPRSPTLSLDDALELTRKLYSQARTTVVKPEVAVKALGYGGTNGAAMTTLATLAQYGLVDRTGGNVAVTPSALRALHPTSQEQKLEALREAAQSPAVFRELLKGFEDCSSEVVIGHLIQNKFIPERAKKVAQVYAANKVYLKLTDSVDPANGDRIDSPQSSVSAAIGSTSTEKGGNLPQRKMEPMDLTGGISHPSKELARYTIPLGANVAELFFVGDELVPEDFDELIEFIKFTKRQFVRREKQQVDARSTTRSIADSPPTVSESAATTQVLIDLDEY